MPTYQNLKGNIDSAYTFLNRTNPVNYLTVKVNILTNSPPDAPQKPKFIQTTAYYQLPNLQDPAKQVSNVTKLQTFDTLIQQLYQCCLCILVDLHAPQNKQFSSSKQNTIQR